MSEHHPQSQKQPLMEYDITLAFRQIAARSFWKSCDLRVIMFEHTTQTPTHRGIKKMQEPDSVPKTSYKFILTVGDARFESTSLIEILTEAGGFQKAGMKKGT